MISSRIFIKVLVILCLSGLSTHGTAQIKACDSKQQLNIDRVLHAIKAQGPFYLDHLNKSKKRADYIRYEGEIYFPKTGVSHNFLYYETKRSPSKKAPLVIIYPGIGGTTYFEKYLASYYASHGVSVVISHYINDVKLHYISNIRSEMLTNLSVGFSLVGFFSTLPRIDANRISIQGVSYGGIRGAYHTALDKRIKSATLMVAGAPFEEILAFSDLETVTEIREQQMLHANITDSGEYLNRLKEEVIPISDFICQRKSEEFFLVISDDDRWVPSENQWQLWDMLGKPEYERSDLGHIGTPLWLGLTKIRYIFNFFAAIWDFTFVSPQRS